MKIHIKFVVREFLQVVGLISSRRDFLKIIPKNKIGAELGVFKGQFSKKLIKCTKPQELYLVDPWWKLHGEYFPSWANKYNQNKPLSTKEAYLKTKESVKKGIENKIVKIIVEKDLEFLASLEDNYLDWVYIDTTHQYEHTKLELEELNRIIKHDGIITGHDWRPDHSHRHHGVFKAVNEFCMEKRWEIVAIDEKYVQWAIKRKNN